MGIIDAHTGCLNNQVLPNLNTLTSTASAHHDRLQALEHRVDQLAGVAALLEQDIRDLTQTFDLLDERLTRFTTMTFGKRLYWLVFGEY